MTGRMLSAHYWTAFGIALVAFALVSPTLPAPVSAGPSPQAWGPASDHLQHIVTIVMENRDYDNYFATYCLTLGPFCSVVGNGIPSGTCVPFNASNPSAGCEAPFNFTAKQFLYQDLPHNWASGRIALNNGSMNGFYKAEGFSNTTFGHYNASTIPIYWDMAEEYAMSDNTFAGNLSFSLPNHWSLLSGAVPAISFDSYVENGSQRVTYLNEANATPSIENLLNNTNISWNYYDWSLYPYARAVTTLGVVSDGSAYNYWNPMAGQGQSYSSPYASHFVPRANFLSDAAAGNLPQLSWLIPPWSQSDHPGTNITMGMTFVAQTVNAVESSPDWNTTAIFVVWDDYGGFYDHVAPPTASGTLLSFRTPMLVISPYARENYIDHHMLDFYSLLHFDEWQFGLSCLTTLDCSAPLPFGLFNFNQSARSPLNFPTLWTSAVYPMPLQRANFGPTWGWEQAPTTPLAWNANDTLPPGVTITNMT